MSAPVRDDARNLRELLRRYHAAMVAADTAALDAMLTDDFALVHLTGYVQPKTEWFDVIAHREYEYHRIRLIEGSLALDMTGDDAAATGRAVFDATIHGMRSPWRLQFTIQLAQHGSAWVIRRAQYDTY